MSNPPSRFRRVLMLTRTRWTEPPRLRHQVARLLAAHGHEVTFLERPSLFHRPDSRTEEGILLRSHRELVHHQLRLARPFSLINTAVMRRDLRRLLADGSPDLVVNLNYDCYVIRELLPSTPIVTIINDDFVNRSRWFARAESRWAYRRTLLVSDETLVVSYPLVRQAQAVTTEVELFLPWARTPYRAPEPGRDRPGVLYWGFLNDRLDWRVIRGLLDEGQLIHFAGPIERTRQAGPILAHPNARYHGVVKLADIEPVLAECSASILPYNLARSHLEVTISNRAFELLSWGLPLVYADYPELLEAPPGVFHKARSVADYQRGIAAARSGFDAMQPVIAGFLEAHTPERRHAQLIAAAGRAADRRAGDR